MRLDRVNSRYEQLRGGWMKLGGWTLHSTRLDLDQIRCGDFGMTPTASRWGPGVWHLPGAQQENIQREIRPSLTPDTRRSTIPPPKKDLVQIRCRARGRTPPARPSRPPQVMPRWVRCVQPEFSAHAGSHRSRARPRPSPFIGRTRLGRLCIICAPPCMPASAPCMPARTSLAPSGARLPSPPPPSPPRRARRAADSPARRPG